jgi:hypothetical protein
MIWDLVQDALSGLGLPLAANTMILATGEQLPDEYIVHQLISSPPIVHADNFETMRMYRVQVAYYNRNGLSGMPDIKGVMVDAGFARSSIRELPYNPETRHFGLALDFIYTSDEEELIESY